MGPILPSRRWKHHRSHAAGDSGIFTDTCTITWPLAAPLSPTEADIHACPNPALLHHVAWRHPRRYPRRTMNHPHDDRERRPRGSPEYERERRKRTQHAGVFGILMGAAVLAVGVNAMRTGAMVMDLHYLAFPGWIVAPMGLFVLILSIWILVGSITGKN